MQSEGLACKLKVSETSEYEIVVELRVNVAVATGVKSGFCLFTE